MLIRVILSALLACSLIAVGATSAGAAAGMHKGRTAQGYQIKLAKRGGTIKFLHFKAKLSCRDGTILVLDESGFKRTPVRRGRFRDAQFGKTDKVYFRGSVGRNAVRGRIRVQDRVGKKRVRCASRWIKFSAKPNRR